MWAACICSTAFLPHRNLAPMGAMASSSEPARMRNRVWWSPHLTSLLTGSPPRSCAASLCGLHASVTLSVLYGRPTLHLLDELLHLLDALEAREGGGAEAELELLPSWSSQGCKKLL